MHPESEGALEQGAAGRMKATGRRRGLPGHGAVGAQGVVGHQFLGKMASDARLQSAGSYKRHSKLLALGFCRFDFQPWRQDSSARHRRPLFTLGAFPSTPYSKSRPGTRSRWPSPSLRPVFASGRTEIPPSCWVVRSAPCMPKWRGGCRREWMYWCARRGAVRC